MVKLWVMVDKVDPADMIIAREAMPADIDDAVRVPELYKTIRETAHEVIDLTRTISDLRAELAAVTAQRDALLKAAKLLVADSPLASYTDTLTVCMLCEATAIDKASFIHQEWCPYRMAKAAIAVGGDK
jgi:hypothetical protein